MKLFVWNVRGAGNRHFLNEPKEYLRLHRPHLLALLETYISGDRANEVRILQFHEQFITIEVNGLQASSWLLMAIYMSPNQLKTKVRKKSNSLDPLHDIHGLLQWTLMTPFHLRKGIMEKADAPITLALHKLSIGLSEWNKEVFGNLKSTYQGVIARVNKQLAGCKSKRLTLARRITLIKSIICAIPAYVDVNCKKARSIYDDIDRKIRRFLQGGTGLERRMHLVP
ncbi:LOW QUALITY PROTEIN: hypothetical protein Cgig2_016820 [Carnegiea gigantea]|uniref:Uncharacterized protein n=1 Tax=Carnegiea gigantea TaxID=171969 RepID=A0A9Q1Q6E6_9CARY|nr:LOW QUALITY PROTEIN: hypothetical protein Cgig2_016820 [Carnegiea gigantea]